MAEQNIEQKVLEKITQGNIKPKPRWQFLLRNYFIWGFGIMSLIVGGLAFSVIIFLVKNNDWDVYEYINDSLIEFTLLSLPYFWILFLVLFVLSAHYNLRHTREGYKFNLPSLVAASIVISVIAGTVLFNAGVGQAIDDVFTAKVPYYEKLFPGRKDRWLRPVEGLLAGKIISLTSRESFKIIDINTRLWMVKTSADNIHPRVIVEVGFPVRLVGEKLDENTFRAFRVLPLQPNLDRWFRGQMMPAPPADRHRPEEPRKFLNEVNENGSKLNKVMGERDYPRN